MRRTVGLLLAALLAVPPGLAEVVTVQADRAQARTMLAADGVRPPIRVVLRSGKQLKGKFAATDDAGLMLKRGGSTQTLAWRDIREIRITHYTDRTKKRGLGALGGLGAAAGVTGALGERIQVSGAAMFGVLALWIALPVYFRNLGARADRGATVIELVENAASAKP